MESFEVMGITLEYDKDSAVLKNTEETKNKGIVEKWVF